MPLPNIQDGELAERLALLSRRLEEEGLYVDAGLVAAALTCFRRHGIIDTATTDADLRYFSVKRLLELPGAVAAFPNAESFHELNARLEAERRAENEAANG